MAAFEQGKSWCSKAIHVAPEDPIANMQLGSLFKDGLEFDEAVKYMEKAAELDPNNPLVLNNLASTLSRQGNIPRATMFMRKALSLEESAVGWFTLGTILAPFDRHSEEGKNAKERGSQLHVDAAVFTPPADRRCGSWTIVRDWMTAKDAQVALVSEGDAEPYGTEVVQGALNAPVDFPLLFFDKDTLAISVADAWLSEGVFYTACEVYLMMGINTDIPNGFLPGTAPADTVVVEDEVIPVVHPNIDNYYHWTVESLTRLLVSVEYFYGAEGNAATARLLLPSRKRCPAVSLLLAPSRHAAVARSPPPHGRHRRRRRAPPIDWPSSGPIVFVEHSTYRLGTRWKPCS